MEDNWLLPPLVGEVYNHQAVIIFETKDKTNTLKYQYSPMYGQLVEEETNYEQKGPTKIIINFPFKGLFHIVWFQSNKQIYNHSIVVNDKPSTLLFASCDMLEANTSSKHCMWQEMHKNLQFDKRISLIHLGDQAYMDAIFNKAVKYTKKHGYSEETSEKILDMYVKRYYQTWNPHHNVLSSVSNYNIWDDHEITNNLMLNDNTVSEEEAYVRNIAVQAYINCQVSQNLNNNTIITPYCWYKRMGSDESILILAIERTSRIVEIEEVLNTIILLADNDFTTKIILCFSGAPLPCPEGKFSSLYKGKFWNDDDVIKLYEGLFEWMGSDYNKEIIVVGGDLHFGSHSIISKHDRDIPIVISSPITNNPSFDRYVASRNMSKTSRKLGDMYFNVISTQPKRCYAEVDLDVYPIKVTMHYSRKKSPKSYFNYFKTLIKFA